MPKKYVGKGLWCNKWWIPTVQCALRIHPQYDIIDLLSKVIVTWFLGRFQDPKFKQVYIQWKIEKKAWSKSLCLKAGIHTMYLTHKSGSNSLWNRICKASDWLNMKMSCTFPVAYVHIRYFKNLVIKLRVLYCFHQFQNVKNVLYNHSDTRYFYLFNFAL